MYGHYQVSRMYKNSTIATDLSSGRKTLISGDLMACDRFLVYALGRILQSLSEGSYYHVLTCKGRKSRTVWKNCPNAQIPFPTWKIH